MSLSPAIKRAAALFCASVAWMSCASAVASAASPSGHPPQDRSIAYAIYYNQWAVYQSPDGKEECPQGLYQWGQRERVRALYPSDGSKPSYKDTRLALEGALWNPKPSNDKIYSFPFPEAGGTKGYGLNLNGNIGAEDFTTPEGEKGIDNQLFRVIGCNDNLRGPDGAFYAAAQRFYRAKTFNRILLQLTNVDDLTNDPDIDVTITRGIDELITDAGGDRALPGGTQRLDTRWTKKFAHHLKGKIVEGVLVTEPAVVRIPDDRLQKPVVEILRGGRFQLKLTPEYAEGILAGYVDVDRFYFNYNLMYTANETSSGREDPLAVYRKLRELADGYPDPQTGANTAISGAMLVKFVQTFVAKPRD